MMSSSSFREIVFQYQKKKMCMVCLKQKTEDHSEPTSCEHCLGVYHVTCLTARAGHARSSMCCLGPEAVGDHFCVYCGKRGASLDHKLGYPIHLLCKVHKTHIENDFIVDGPRQCKFCSSSRGMVFKCRGDQEHGCRDVFHAHCHQNLPLSAPEALERYFFGRISLSCLTATSAERLQHVKEYKKICEVYKAHLDKLENDTSLINFSLAMQNSKDEPHHPADQSLNLDFRRELSNMTGPSSSLRPMPGGKPYAPTSQDTTVRAVLQRLEGKHVSEQPSLSSAAKHRPGQEGNKQKPRVLACKSAGGTKAAGEAGGRIEEKEGARFRPEVIVEEKFLEPTIDKDALNHFPSESVSEKKQSPTKSNVEIIFTSVECIKNIDLSELKFNLMKEFEAFQELVEIQPSLPIMVLEPEGCLEQEIKAYMAQRVQESLDLVNAVVGTAP
jgi:hypothetical protein